MAGDTRQCGQDRRRSGEVLYNLEHFISDAAGMHVIITSRNATAQEMTDLEVVEVEDLKAPEAQELFRELGGIVQRLGTDPIMWLNQTWRSFLFNGQLWTVYELEAAFGTKILSTSAEIGSG